MKVYLGIKFHPDNRNRDRIELISQALSLYGCEIVCIRRDIEQWGAVQLASRELTAPYPLRAHIYRVRVPDEPRGKHQ